LYLDVQSPCRGVKTGLAGLNSNWSYLCFQVGGEEPRIRRLFVSGGSHLAVAQRKHPLCHCGQAAKVVLFALLLGSSIKIKGMQPVPKNGCS
jgi:hypothetical protein